MPKPIPAPVTVPGGHVQPRPPKPRGYLTAPSAKALTKDPASIKANIGKIAGVNKGLLPDAARSPKGNGNSNGGGPPPPTVVAVAPPEDPIMRMFRTTLEQIKANVSPVDEAAIYKPYRESEGVAMNLGGQAAVADHNNSVRASDQYVKSSDESAQHAAQFGIAGGAGAGTVRPDATQTLLAQQDQAQQNAHTGAAQAWANLLERTGANAVNTAKQTRQGTIDTASASLAASIPTMYNQADTLKLSRDSAEANNRYLYASLDAKGRQFYRSDQTTRRGQDVSSDNNKRTVQGAGDRSAAEIEAANTRSTNSINAANSRNAATIKGAATRAAMQKKAGVKGTDKVLKLITPGKVTDQRKLTGHWVTYVADADGIAVGAPPQRQYVPVGQSAPPVPGFTAGPPDNGLPVYAPAKAGKAANTGVTLKDWMTGVGIYMNENGWTRAQATKAMQRLTPRPPK